MPWDKTIAALADPTRREILRRLGKAPHRAGELAAGFAITRPAICKHTRLLSTAGLIRVTKSGRERSYQLAPSGKQSIYELIGTLEQVGHFWDSALEAFKHYAESEQGEEPSVAGQRNFRSTQIKRVSTSAARTASRGIEVMTIRKSIWVERSPEIAFRVFCHDISEWWPGGFSGKDSKVFLEGEVGGRFYERRPDGSEYEIGRVTAYQRPSLMGFTWRAPSWDVDTEVEIRFSPENGGTRVELDHTGWEQSAKTRDTRNNYDSGWGTILGHYQKALAGSA